MLRAACTITASTGGPGTYTATVLFSDAAQGAFVRVGDTLEDRLGNRYEITSWNTSPNDFESGGTLTVDFITTDILPATFGGFGNANVFTPNQVDIRPAVRSAGNIFTQSLSSGQNYEYNLTCSWFDASATNVQIGDTIMDGNGKVFIITATDGNASTVTVTESEKEGKSPVLGTASLYRPTNFIGAFQGTPVSDPARTNARNRDDFNIDLKLATLENSGGGSGTYISSTLQNNSGITILKASPVRSIAGEVSGSIDLSVEDQALSVIGVASANIADGASGSIITNGRVVDITTTADLDDTLWVSKSGTLTNSPPTIGVDGFVTGDFVIMIGVIVRNETDIGKKDLIVHRQVIGQL